MTLPTTYDEYNAAEALTFAREWIGRAHEPGGPLHPGLDVKAMMREFALAHPFAADEIVYLAENGSKDAHMALREIIAERTDRREDLGVVFGAYSIRIANPMPRQHGPARACNFVRDCTITLLMTELLDRFRLRPTRNTTGGRASASSIAAQALVAAGVVAIDFKAVEKIWRRYRPALADTRFAVGGFPANYVGLLS
jgi:hypothetical protein